MKTSRPGGFPCQAGVHGDFQVCRLTASIAIIGITIIGISIIGISIIGISIIDISIIGISIIPSSMTETFNFISGRLQMDFLANLPQASSKTLLRFFSSTVKFYHDHQHDNYDDHQYDNNDDHQHNNDDHHQ